MNSMVQNDPSAANPPLPRTPRAAGWELVALFLLFAATAAGIAFFSYHQYREELIADRQQEVIGYAADKAAHIKHWQASFREELEPLSRDSLLAREVERWLARGARRDDSEQDLLADLSIYLRGRKFLAIFIYDPHGEIRLAVNPRARPPSPLARLRALEVIRTRQGVLTDLHRGNTPEDRKIIFDYLVPLMYPSGAGMKAVAAAYLRIDPETTIYPLLRPEPDQRQALEALLISRRGNRFLHFDDPSLHAPSWPEFGSEVEDPPTVAALFSRGTMGAFEGGDQRGAAVIGAVRPVAGTDWLVLARGNRDALLSPLAARARATTGLALGFISLLALALFWLWRKQRAEMSARNIEIESRRFREDILRDITERRRMGDLLRDQLNFINRLLETIPSPVFYKDENGRYLGCNQAFEQFMGLTKAEVIGKGVYDIAPKELAEQYDAADRALFDRPGVQMYEAQVKYADGSLHEVLFSKATFNKADGALGGLVGVMLDITERKRAEAELRKRENRLSILFERAGDIILVHDREGRILDVNRQACASLGYEREELLGMAVRDIDLHCVPGRPEGPWSTLGEGETTTVEGLHRRKDGATFPVEVRVSLVKDGSDPLFLAVVRDVSERKHAEDILRDTRDKLRAVIWASPLAIVSLDLEGRITMWNPAAERIFGWSALEALGRIPPFVPPEKTGEFRALHRRVCDGENLTEIELRRRKKDGSPICVSLSVAPLYGPQRSVCGALGLFADITAQQETAQQLRLYARVFEASHDAIIITSPANEIIAVNQAFTDITGYAQEEVLGKNPKMLSSGRQDQGFYINMWTSIREDDHWQGEIWNRRKNGEVYPEWVTISAIRNARGEITHYVAIFSDISERKAAEEHISYLAQHDGLTGLPNRTLMQDRLQQALAAAGRAGGLVAVLFLDLDHFKNINDSLGHQVGDRLLISVAERISDSVRVSDTVSRIGGDEFVIILPTVAEADDIALVAEKIIRNLSQPYQLDGHEINTTPSIGIAVYPGDGEDMGTLIRNADTAMYHAKESGRNRYQFFTPDMNARAMERMRTENHLRRAIERDEFLLYYQPQVEIASSRVVGMEALLRWRHPEMGLVTPVKFIRVAEDSGLIVAIGEWVIREACRQNRAWQAAGLPAVPVAVNLSAAQFRSKELPDTVERALRDSGLEACYLELELTESSLMRDPEATAAMLERVKAMGVRVTIDDFGTGRSLFSYLKRFPIDKLKLDSSFVREITSGPGNQAIVSAIIAMGHSLGLAVTAEGVEIKEQLEFLKTRRCDQMHGHLVSEALPAELAERLLAGRR